MTAKHSASGFTPTNTGGRAPYLAAPIAAVNSEAAGHALRQNKKLSREEAMLAGILSGG